MRWILMILAAGVFLLILVCAESFRECRHFTVTHYYLDVACCDPGAKAQTLVFLSDLHERCYGKENKKLLKSIREQRPDLILAGGDMLIGKHRVKADTAKAFAVQLPAIAPVYFANGNHEQRMKEQTKIYGRAFCQYQRELTAAGVQFLENRSAELLCGGMRLRISGLELPGFTYQGVDGREVSVEMLNRRLGRTDRKRFEILLAHNPVFFPVYKKWGADLTLSGHLHGGVVRIPGWRGVVTPQLKFFPKYSGEMTTEDGHTLVVSRGLGTHTIHFRLFNRPELVVIHLQPCKNS